MVDAFRKRYRSRRAKVTRKVALCLRSTIGPVGYPARSNPGRTQYSQDRDVTGPELVNFTVKRAGGTL